MFCTKETIKQQQGMSATMRDGTQQLTFPFFFATSVRRHSPSFLAHNPPLGALGDTLRVPVAGSKVKGTLEPIRSNECYNTHWL